MSDIAEPKPPLKLWIDAEIPPPETPNREWAWAKNIAEATACLKVWRHNHLIASLNPLSDLASEVGEWVRVNGFKPDELQLHATRTESSQSLTERASRT